MSEKKSFKTVGVEIQRGKYVITCEVPEHEVRVLKAIHGVDEQVQIVDKDAGEIELDANAHAEYARLQRTYQRTGAPDPVRVAYPMGAEDMRSFGFDADVAQAKAPQSFVKNHAKARKAEKAASKK